MILLVKMLANYNVRGAKHSRFNVFVEQPSADKNKGNNYTVLPKLFFKETLDF